MSERARRPASPRHLARTFVSSIFEKATFLRSFDTTRTQRARVLESITADIRKYTDCITPDVSIAARKAAERIGIELREKRWQDQPSFDPGRSLFHWEHMTTVSHIREQCTGAESREAIAEVLGTECRVVWILKTENSELARLGYTHKRPDPEAAYRAARIEILKNDA